MADQLVTIAQVKARINVAGVSDTDDDTLLGELVDQVSSWVQGYTGRRFMPEPAATYVFDTSAGTVLRIPHGIRAVTSVGVATVSQPDTGGNYTTVPTGDVILRPKAQDMPEGWPATELWIRYGTLSGTITQFATAQNGATITGTFGWASVPPDIQAVVIDAVVAAYQSRKNGASSVMGADGTALPPWSAFFGRGSPQRGTLDRYRYMAL